MSSPNSTQRKSPQATTSQILDVIPDVPTWLSTKSLTKRGVEWYMK